MSDEFNGLAEQKFITASQLTIMAVGIWAIIQTLAFLFTPNEWRNWQLLGFIASTNLAAVILAILAQRSADMLANTYRQVFTADFYRSVSTVATLHKLMTEEAESRGHDMKSELEDLAPKLYGLARQYIEVKSQEIVPPEVAIEVPENYDDDDLFRDAS